MKSNNFAQSYLEYCVGEMHFWRMRLLQYAEKVQTLGDMSWSTIAYDGSTSYDWRNLHDHTQAIGEVTQAANKLSEYCGKLSAAISNVAETPCLYAAFDRYDEEVARMFLEPSANKWIVFHEDIKDWNEDEKSEYDTYEAARSYFEAETQNADNKQPPELTPAFTQSILDMICPDPSTMLQKKREWHQVKWEDYASEPDSEHESRRVHHVRGGALYLTMVTEQTERVYYPKVVDAWYV